ncbi:hypothetical protein M9H77_30248 [Catharanthus roseus]|uniref:Uncharacterized protein n=1 Tax=Catharanthus roseus TaxID=4058 RepID=A0ACB9ZXM0_CATRO|nr:hypothetical protein M9H77_30248 [Catharanthus roseus]
MKKLKLQEDNDMITYLEDTLKSKIEEFDGQGKPPKLLTSAGTLGKASHLLLKISSTLPSPVFDWSVEATKSSKEVLHEGGDLGKVWNQFYLQLKIHIKVVLEKPPIEGQFDLNLVPPCSCTVNTFMVGYALNFYVHTTFDWPFKEARHFWNSFGVEKMFNKLEALLAYTLLRIESV